MCVVAKLPLIWNLCVFCTLTQFGVCVAFGKLLHGENLRVWNFVRTFVPFGLYFACDKWRGCWSMRTQPMARVCIIPSAHFNVLFNSNTRFSSILLATRLILALVASAIWWIASCKNVSRGFCCCYIGCVLILSRHIVLCVVAVDFFFSLYLLCHMYLRNTKSENHTPYMCILVVYLVRTKACSKQDISACFRVLNYFTSWIYF